MRAVARQAWARSTLVIVAPSAEDAQGWRQEDTGVQQASLAAASPARSETQPNRRQPVALTWCYRRHALAAGARISMAHPGLQGSVLMRRRPPHIEGNEAAAPACVGHLRCCLAGCRAVHGPRCGHREPTSTMRPSVSNTRKGHFCRIRFACIITLTTDK